MNSLLTVHALPPPPAPPCIPQVMLTMLTMIMLTMLTMINMTMLTMIMLMINIIDHYHQVVLMVIMTILKLPQHFCFRRNSQLVTLYYLPLRASLPYQGFPSHLHGHIIVMFGLVNIGMNVAIRPKPKQGQKKLYQPFI